MLAKLSDLYKRMDDEEERAAGSLGLTTFAAITNASSDGGSVATDVGEGGGGGLSRSRSYLLAKRMAAGAKFMIDRGTLLSATTASDASATTKGPTSAMALENEGQAEQQGVSGVGDKRSRSSEIDPRLATPDELKVSRSNVTCRGSEGRVPLARSLSHHSPERSTLCAFPTLITTASTNSTKPPSVP